MQKSRGRIKASHLHRVPPCGCAAHLPAAPVKFPSDPFVSAASAQNASSFRPRRGRLRPARPRGAHELPPDYLHPENRSLRPPPMMKDFFFANTARFGWARSAPEPSWSARRPASALPTLSDLPAISGWTALWARAGFLAAPPKRRQTPQAARFPPYKPALRPSEDVANTQLQAVPDIRMARWQLQHPAHHDVADGGPFAGRDPRFAASGCRPMPDDSKRGCSHRHPVRHPRPYGLAAADELAAAPLRIGEIGSSDPSPPDP